MSNHSLEDEAQRILRHADAEDMATKCAVFLEAMERLRPLTEGRRHTPAEVLIRKDRDYGHFEDC